VDSLWQRALNLLWDEYKHLEILGACAASKRARTPDDFELGNDITKIAKFDQVNELELWNL
jgi:hypothetical protein